MSGALAKTAEANGLTNTSSSAPLSIDLERFDGSGRKPRAVQRQFLEWLIANWNDADCFAAQLPVGSGKSAIAKAIGHHVITPSNALINQYISEYKKSNFLMGKARYPCRASVNLSCEDFCKIGVGACTECPYQKSKTRADSEQTFFNPMSLFYYRLNQKNKERLPLLVVDEAHQLPGMMMKLVEKKYRKADYHYPSDVTTQLGLERWLCAMIAKLERQLALYKGPKYRTKTTLIKGEISDLGLMLESFRHDPQNFAIYTAKKKHFGKVEEFLYIRPVRPPENIVRTMLDCDKLVLLSGTLFPADIEDLAPKRTVKFLDLPSPIPKERRPVLYKPATFPLNIDTDPRRVVQWIESVLEAFPRRSTMIHTSYAQSVKLAPHFTRPILVNTKEDKEDVLARFKKDGGVFLASGCAEGIDLKDDLCRLNIIPKLQYPNLADPAISKRKALAGGEQWYALETLKIAIQQIGRSTRHEKDESVTVVGDPLFSTLVCRYKDKLPRSFVEAIRWSAK